MYEDKVVLITGGSQGIGRTTAIAFAQAGAKVMIADIDADAGSDTVHTITSVGGTASYITADVGSEDEVRDMIDAAVAQFGGLHIAVNNAGVGGAMGALHEADEETFDRVMQVNVKGVWWCMKYEIPALIRSGGGSIVNIASIAGLVGFRGNAIYAASKHAVVGMTKSAALELATNSVRVNAICPSFINTPMVTEMVEDDERLERGVQVASPMRRMGRPEEVAESILWLASDKASFVNGVAFAVDGGLTAM